MILTPLSSCSSSSSWTSDFSLDASPSYECAKKLFKEDEKFCSYMKHHHVETIICSAEDTARRRTCVECKREWTRYDADVTRRYFKCMHDLNPLLSDQLEIQSFCQKHGLPLHFGAIADGGDMACTSCDNGDTCGPCRGKTAHLTLNKRSGGARRCTMLTFKCRACCTRDDEMLKPMQVARCNCF